MIKRKDIWRRVPAYGAVIFAVFMCGFFLSGTASAATPDDPIAPRTEGVTGVSSVAPVYQLLPTSKFFEGCVPPCMCPVSMSDTVAGTFRLVPLKPSPLFNRYSVNGIRWNVTDQSGIVVHTITGNGFYEEGGEVALTQQMVLHLRIDGGPFSTFDSGVVPVTSVFPDISITVGRGACYRIVVTINATPGS